MSIRQRFDEPEIAPAKEADKADSVFGSSDSANRGLAAQAEAARQRRQQDDELANASSDNEIAQAKTRGRGQVAVGDMELPEIRLNITSDITHAEIDKRLHEIAEEHREVGAFRLVLDGSSAFSDEGEIHLTMGLEIGTGFEQHVFIERDGAEHSHMEMPDFITASGERGFGTDFLHCWFIGMGTAAHWIMELLGAIDGHLGGIMTLDHERADQRRQEVTEGLAAGSQSKFGKREEQEAAAAEAPKVEKAVAKEAAPAPVESVEKAIAEREKDPVAAVTSPEKKASEDAPVMAPAAAKQQEPESKGKNSRERSELNFPIELAGHAYDTHYAHASHGATAENRVEIAGALSGFHGEESSVQDRVEELLREVFGSLEALDAFPWAEQLTNNLYAAIANQLGTGAIAPECQTRLVFQWSEQDGQLQMFGASVISEQAKPQEKEEESSAVSPTLSRDATEVSEKLRELPPSVAENGSAPRGETAAILSVFEDYAADPEQLSAFIDALIKHDVDLKKLGTLAEACGLDSRLAALSATAKQAHIDLHFV